MPTPKEKPYVVKQGKRDQLPTNTCTISLALGPEVYERLITLSEQEDRSISSLVRVAIKEMLNRLKVK